MKPGYSTWIKDEDDKRVFGIGPYRLLVLVEQLGSLNKAAKEMGLSYSKAINILNRAESGMNTKLLDREVGGTNGGGSSLTPEALIIMSKYKHFRDSSSLAIEKIYEEIFGSEN